MTNRVGTAIAAIARGLPILVTDDRDRENEADLVIAADAVDAANIAFMAIECRGLICLAMEPERLEKLELGLMVPDSVAETNFTVSIDLDVPGTTGISAYDRAATIRRAVDVSANPRDFRRPGHVFPLRYTPGGVLARRGHTEASVDLARLAGRTPAAVICEVMNDDGTMANGTAVQRFADRYCLKIVSIEEIVEFIVENGLDELGLRSHHDKALEVEMVVRTSLPTRFGRWHTTGFRSSDGLEYVVMTLGNENHIDPQLVRVHSECLTGDALGSQRCDCGDQLTMAMQQIASEGQGAVVYVRGHEGRGIGLLPKLQAYALQDRGLDTVDANLELGYQVDAREYEGVAEVLRAMDIRSVKLLTNNPRKVEALVENGISVAAQIPLVTPTTVDNYAYMSTKRSRLEHLLPNDGLEAITQSSGLGVSQVS